MKEVLFLFVNGRQSNEDDLTFFGEWKMISHFFVNGRRSQFFGNRKRPQFLLLIEDDLKFVCKWKTFSICL